MKTSSEIPTKYFLMVLSSCRPLPEDPPCPIDAFLVTADGNPFNQVCGVIKRINLKQT